MTKKRVVAYCRVSTGKVEQATSLVNQKQYFNDFCEDEDDYDLLEVFADEGISGTKLSRPHFDTMLEQAGLDKEYLSNGEAHFIESDREPLFDIILIKDTARFARNTLAMAIVDKLRRKKVYINFVTIGLCTEDLTSDIMLNILMTLDAEDSKSKGRKVKLGHRQGMKAEVPVIPGLSYGYKKIDTKHLEIVPEQADVVRFIFDMYVNHSMGIRGIAEECEHRGYRAKRGGVLKTSTLTLMLKNPIYKGTLVRGKHDYSTLTQDKVDMLKVNDEYFVHDNHVGIPIIIDAETWDKVQDIMLEKITFDGKSTRGKKKSKSKYHGLIKCSVCGSNYRLNVDRGRRYYTCGNKRDNGIKACKSKNINETILDDLITLYATAEYKNKVVDKIENAIYNFNRFKKSIFNRMKADKDVVTIAQKRAELDKIQGSKMQLLNLMKKGIYSEDEVAVEAEGYNEQMNKLESEINELDKGTEGYLNDIRELDETIHRLEEIEIKDEYSIDEIMTEIEYILLTDIALDKKGNQIFIRFKIDELIKSYRKKYMKTGKAQTVEELTAAGYTVHVSSESK